MNDWWNWLTARWGGSAPGHKRPDAVERQYDGEVEAVMRFVVAKTPLRHRPGDPPGRTAERPVSRARKRIWIDCLRRKKRERIERSIEGLEVKGQDGQVGGALEQHEQLRRLAEARGRISPRSRLVLKLVYDEERTATEIAARCGRDESTVRRWVAAAMTELRTEFFKRAA